MGWVLILYMVYYFYNNALSGICVCVCVCVCVCLCARKTDTAHKQPGCKAMKGTVSYLFSSVQFSCSVASDFLWPHESQHTRPPCPSPTPGVHSNSCPLSRWCHPTISSSVVPFSACLQSFPASGSLHMSQFFTSDGQSIVSPSNEYSGLISFRMDWLFWMSLKTALWTLKVERNRLG